jgi:hypothetical protein
MLDQERKYFADNIKSLLENYRGRFVVIKETSVLGPFATIDEALSEGARRYGLHAFLVRQVEEQSQDTVSIPALALGLLHADPPHAIRRAE